MTVGPRSRRRSAWATTAAAAVVAVAGVARADDARFPPPAPGAAAERSSALRSAVEDLVGAEVHGRFSVEYRGRRARGDVHEADDDLFARLDLRIADEAVSPFSAGAMLRTSWDGDRPERLAGGRVFRSLADARDHDVATFLYTGWAQWRPANGPFETVRVGRQFVDVAETFHVDGAAVTTFPLRDARNLRLLVYGGVPAHLWEDSPRGDGIAGLRASADPWKGAHAALDAAYVRDEIAGFGDERDDLAAISLRQRLDDATTVDGRFLWLDGPSEVRVRGTRRFEAQDLTLTASYKRLLEDREQMTTQLDPFFRTLRTLHEYHLVEGRAVKGFGDAVQVEAGAWVREVASDDDEGPFNRDTRRVWLAPSVDGVPWERSQLTVGVESWSGDGQRIRTWTADLTHRVSDTLRVSVGTDYALYAYGELRLGERTHVRTAYARARARLTESVSLDVRYAWERDEETTWHVLSLGLAVDF